MRQALSYARIETMRVLPWLQLALTCLVIVVGLTACSDVPFVAVVDGREADIDQLWVRSVSVNGDLTFSVWGYRENDSDTTDGDSAYVVDFVLDQRVRETTGMYDLASRWKQAAPGAVVDFAPAQAGSPLKSLRVYYLCFGCDKPTHQEHEGTLKLVPKEDSISAELDLSTTDLSGDWYYFDHIQINSTFVIAPDR